jgi:hypothetical protein
MDFPIDVSYPPPRRPDEETAKSDQEQPGKKQEKVTFDMFADDAELPTEVGFASSPTLSD